MNPRNPDKKQNLSYDTFDKEETGPPFGRKEIADFLYEHLDEYGDEYDHIIRCLEYTFSSEEGKGGFVELAHDSGRIVGAAVVNYTGMSGYIPENFLVYIAVDKRSRGSGIGKKLMERTIAHTHGALALHVEPDNPARFLYEKYGFTNKYLEMRLQK